MACNERQLTYVERVHRINRPLLDAQRLKRLEAPHIQDAHTIRRVVIRIVVNRRTNTRYHDA